MSSYVISNIYSPKNIGDRSIVEGIIKSIQSIDPDAEIHCLSKYRDEILEFTSWKSRHELVHLPTNSGVLCALIAPIVSIIRFFFLLLIYKINKKFVLFFLSVEDPFCAIIDAKFVAVAGGNYLFSSNKSFFSRTMIVHLLNIYLPTLLNKDVIVFPQTIGPFYRKYEEFLAGFALKRVKIIMTRDKESYDFLVKKGVSNSKCVMVPDIAFLLSDKAQLKSRSGLRSALITVLDWPWGFDARSKKDYDVVIGNYKITISKIIDYMALELNVGVSLLAHVTADGSNDLLISQEIAEMCKSNVEIVDMTRMQISDILDYYNRHDLVIGSRMHSCILAIGQRIPTIGLAYQPKGRGLFNLLSLQDYCLDANGLSYVDLKRIVDHFASNYSSVTKEYEAVIESMSYEMKGLSKIIAAK